MPSQADSKRIDPSASLRTKPPVGAAKCVPEQEHVGVGDVLQDGAAGGARRVLVPVGHGGEVRVRDLHRIVDHVAGDQRALTTRLDLDAGVAGGVPRRGPERHMGRDAVVHVDEVVQLCRDDRFDVVGQVDVVRVLVVLPVVVLGLPEQVARVRERRHPPAVDQLGVPPDVVEVQVRAQHDIDGFAWRARGREIVEEGGLQRLHVLVGQVAIVAETRVDEDHLAVRLDDEGLDRDLEHPVGGDVVGHDPRPLRPERVHVEADQQLDAGQVEHDLRHAPHAHLTDLPFEHQIPLLSVAISVVRQLSANVCELGA